MTTKPKRILTARPDKGGRYRWWAVCPQNGKTTAVSGEDFASPGNAMRAARQEYKHWPAGTVEFVKG